MAPDLERTAGPPDEPSPGPALADRYRALIDGSPAVVYVEETGPAASMLDALALRRGEVHGRLRVGQDGDITIIRFNDRHLVDEGEISLIHKDLHEHLNRPNLRVLLDCKNVKRMSTAAVMMFDELCTWLKPWGSTMALCRVRSELQDAFKGLPLTNHIRQFADKPSALATRW